jgi:hypothetical protein
LLVSLPIPSEGAQHSFAQVRWRDTNLGSLVAELSGGRIHPDKPCHLDPDLDPGALPRSPGWRAIFGQCSAAQRHLEKQGVQEGDLFLFFGWFRPVESHGGRLSYARKAPDLHALFGWLQVGSSRPITSELSSELPWAAYHDHLNRERPRNHLYIATDRLHLGGVPIDLPGGGTFCQYHESLRLTASARSRSIWALPEWFFPGNERRPLSYHGAPERWERTSRGVLLRTVGRGQEFVLDLEHYPAALPWVRGILQNAAG